MEYKVNNKYFIGFFFFIFYFFKRKMYAENTLKNMKYDFFSFGEEKNYVIKQT